MRAAAAAADGPRHMRREKLLRRGWAQAVLVGYALVVFAVMLAAGGLPRL